MAKRKAGLHKEITAIFGGAPVVKNKDTQQPPHGPAPDRAGYDEAHLRPSKAGFGSPVPPKPPVPASKIPEAPKREEPVQSVPKVVPIEQAKVDTTVINAGQALWQRICGQIKDRLFAPKPGVNTAKQKAMAVLVPVLFIVLIFVFVKVLGGPKGKVQVPTKPGPANAVAGSVGKIDWHIPDPYPTTLRDPMQFGRVTPAHPGTDRPDAKRLIVKGIVFSKHNPSALIDTEIVHEQETVFGATVVKINKDSVEFEMNGKRWTQKVQR